MKDDEYVFYFILENVPHTSVQKCITYPRSKSCSDFLKNFCGLETSKLKYSLGNVLQICLRGLGATPRLSPWAEKVLMNQCIS